MPHLPIDLQLWEIRKQAVVAVEDGETVADAARDAGVTERAVYRWLARARRHGEHGLALVQMHGRRPAVSEHEVFAVFDWLDARGHLTLKAAADRIERKYGIRYSLANVQSTEGDVVG